MRAPVAPHPYQHLVLAVTTLTGVMASHNCFSFQFSKDIAELETGRLFRMMRIGTISQGSLHVKEGGSEVSIRGKLEMLYCWLWRWRVRHEPRKADSLHKLERQGNRFSPSASRGCSPANTLTLAHETQFEFMTSKIVIINLCSLSHWGCGKLLQQSWETSTL